MRNALVFLLILGCYEYSNDELSEMTKQAMKSKTGVDIMIKPVEEESKVSP